MKLCSKCGESLELSFFNKCSATPDGHQAWCRTCQNAHIAKARKGSEREKKRQRDTYLLNREKRLAQMAARAAAHPLQAKARLAVRKAIKTQQMAPPSACQCEDCNSAQAEHMHHHSYAEEHWLDVIPLCRSCHMKRHVL